MPERCMNDIFSEYYPEFDYRWVTVWNTYKSKLVMKSHSDAFLTPLLISVDPTVFVDCISFLCRHSLPLLNPQNGVKAKLGTMSRCVCGSCPLIAEDITPFKCGPDFKFDWLFSDIEDYSFTNTEVAKLFLKLNMTHYSFLKEEYHLTKMAFNKELCCRFDNPISAFRYLLRLRTGSIPTAKDFNLVLSACGCNLCPIFKPLYWEKVGDASHISSLMKEGREYLCNITWRNCEKSFQTNHQWMEGFFKNVESDSSTPLIVQVPTYEAFVELIEEMSFSSLDMSLLGGGHRRKAYFNAKYGCRRMMVLVTVIQKGLGIHVPWHVYNDPKIARKAKKYLDLIELEKSGLDSSELAEMSTRNLVIALKEGEPVSTTLDVDCFDEFQKAFMPKRPLEVTIIPDEKHTIIPENMGYFKEIEERFKKVYDECLTPAWNQRREEIQKTLPNFQPWEEFRADMVKSFSGESEIILKKRGKLESHNISHTCEPLLKEIKNKKNPRTVQKCSVYPKDLDKKILEFGVNGVDHTKEIVAKRKRAAYLKEEESRDNVKEMLRVRELSKGMFIKRSVKFKLTYQKVKEHLEIAPSNLLMSGHCTEVESHEKMRLNRALGATLLALRKSLIKSVNDQLASINFPFYFNNSLKVKWLGYAVPLGCSSNYHEQAMLDKYRNLFESKSFVQLINIAMSEFGELQQSKNYLASVASELKRRALRTCKSRKLRLEISALPCDKIIYLQQNLGCQPMKVIREELHMRSGVIKRLAMMRILSGKSKAPR
jgi:hypothetical protein